MILPPTNKTRMVELILVVSNRREEKSVESILLDETNVDAMMERLPLWFIRKVKQTVKKK